MQLKGYILKTFFSEMKSIKKARQGGVTGALLGGGAGDEGNEVELANNNWQELLLTHSRLSKSLLSSSWQLADIA